MEDSLKNAYYQEQIVEASKGKGAGYTIAWILAAIFILAILFWVFNRASCNHNDMSNRTADHNCAQSTRIGMLEGEMKSVGIVLSQLVPQVNELGRFATGTSVGLNEYVKCTDKEFAHTYRSIYALDGAVFTSRCGHERSGCGDNRGGCGNNRRFDQISTYEPKTTEVRVSESCQN